MKSVLFPLLVVFLFLILSGCAGSVVTRVQTVEVPIAVPCKVIPPTKPVYPLQEASIEEDFFTKVKKALAEIELRKGYETKLEAAVKSCSE